MNGNQIQKNGWMLRTIDWLHMQHILVLNTAMTVKSLYICVKNFSESNSIRASTVVNMGGLLSSIDDISNNVDVKKMKSTDDLINWALVTPPKNFNPAKHDKETMEAIAKQPMLKALFVKDIGGDEKNLQWNYQKFIHFQKEQYQDEQLKFIVDVDKLTKMVNDLGSKMPAIGEKWPADVTKEMERMRRVYFEKGRTSGSDEPLDTGSESLNTESSFFNAVRNGKPWAKSLDHRTAENDPRVTENDNVKLDKIASKWIQQKKHQLKEIRRAYEDGFIKTGPDVMKRHMVKAYGKDRAKQVEESTAKGKKSKAKRAMWEGYGSEYVGPVSWYVSISDTLHALTHCVCLSQKVRRFATIERVIWPDAATVCSGSLRLGRRRGCGSVSISECAVHCAWSRVLPVHVLRWICGWLRGQKQAESAAHAQNQRRQ